MLIGNTNMGKRQTVVLLRWVLIIAFSYLLLLDAAATAVQSRLVLLIALALASNLVIGRMPDHWAERRAFDFGVVLFDAAWVTLGLIWAPYVSGDLFLLYFLVMFVAAMGESLETIVGSAFVVSVVYGATMSLQQGQDFRLTSAALLRVPFLFVVALFYGYFVTEIRGRRSEAAEARLREQAKSELLAAVSHDLRGPLGNAESLLALVLDTDSRGGADERMLLLRVQVNVRRVSSLVVNLLQASCIEKGQVALQWAPVQLNDVVDDVFGPEAGAALLKDVTLRADTHPDLPMVTADFVQMGRIVTNLVNNAIKYCGAGGTVTVRTWFGAEHVYLSVEDNGPGMSPEQCQALFAPYRRVHLGGYTPGMGLGLYIVKRLIEAQGGTVCVSSQPGVGSTFVVSLPRTPRLPGEAGRRVRRKGSVGAPRVRPRPATAVDAAAA
ncbi:MAG TPA: HAMP domain-containing sensor histidine kinase [Candidatus Margulisiibacteriota bacterium]|nr:HAMP domain-containing sensor histidine kinase [Candidatus Margulisiibacteriota bacterium]